MANAMRIVSLPNDDLEVLQSDEPDLGDLTPISAIWKAKVVA